MNESFTPGLYVSLMHHPVRNKNREVITSAITSVDLHDIARASRTYGVRAFYVVTPLEDQQDFAQRIMSHWVTGYGNSYNPNRGDALELIRICSGLEDVLKDISEREGQGPETVVTSARQGERNSISFSLLKERLKNDNPFLLMFGTAWGLTEEFLDQADYLLEPVKGVTGYNHLSVRSAASIILDRLVGDTRE